MDIFITLVVAVWYVRVVRNVVSFAALWYVKEYRFDRMWVHLGTPQGKRVYYLPFRLPPKNKKSFVFIGVLSICLILLYFILPFDWWGKMIFVDLTSFPLTWLIVAVMGVPTRMYHAYLISKARAKLAAHAPMKTIGITGSYGKTSTKEYLATILSSQYKVLKTEASKNSPIGIAELVLRELRDDHQVFVVEMGAYKMGEIGEMCRLVEPQIGIVTAVNPQHQDLFGSIENTQKTKYELLAGLTGEKIAIVNADNPLTCQMGEWARRDSCQVWHFTQDGTVSAAVERTFVYTKVVGDFRGVRFELQQGKNSVRVTAPVLGDHQATNITAAIAGAVAVGMDLVSACKAAGTLTAFTKTMKPLSGISDSLFINDTFNNNPDAAIAAIRFMAKTHKGKRILVFQPMIELGAYADESHEAVGKHAAKVCSDVILTNDNFSAAFLRGVASVKGKCRAAVMRPEQAAEHIRKTVGKGDIVLFKGKEAERVLELLE